MDLPTKIGRHGMKRWAYMQNGAERGMAYLATMLKVLEG
jgi:hypothetical protein